MKNRLYIEDGATFVSESTCTCHPCLTLIYLSSRGPFHKDRFIIAWSKFYKKIWSNCESIWSHVMTEKKISWQICKIVISLVCYFSNMSSRYFLKGLYYETISRFVKCIRDPSWCITHGSSMDSEMRNVYELQLLLTGGFWWNGYWCWRPTN